jgi:hypothetical protein
MAVKSLPYGSKQYRYNCDELGGLINNDVPFTEIGKICIKDCDTTCVHYCNGTCPCKTMKDTFGYTIHVFVASNL